MSLGKFSALKLATEVARKMEIGHPVTGMPMRTVEGEVAFIELFSADSSIAKKFDREMLDRRLGRKVKVTAAELEEENLIRAAKLTKSWMLLSPDSMEVLEVECSEASAIELYRDCEWLLEQVLDFSRGRGNFSKS